MSSWMLCDNTAGTILLEREFHERAKARAISSSKSETDDRKNLELTKSLFTKLSVNHRNEFLEYLVENLSEEELNKFRFVG